MDKYGRKGVEEIERLHPRTAHAELGYGYLPLHETGGEDDARP